MMVAMAAAGLMNVFWMAGMALVMTAEKMIARPWFTRALGVTLVAGGLLLSLSEVGSGGGPALPRLLSRRIPRNTPRKSARPRRRPLALCRADVLSGPARAPRHIPDARAAGARVLPRPVRRVTEPSEDGRPPLKSFAERLPAYLVHFFTASGGALAFFALFEAFAGDFARAFAWLGVALVVDGIDGTIARALHVRDRVPNISGDVLDLVIDFTTYVFVPAAILVLCRHLAARARAWRWASSSSCRPRSISPTCG